MPDRSWSHLTLLALGMAAAATIGSASAAEKPSRLESIPGSDLKRVILTAKAAERLDIRTAAVTEQPGQRWLVLQGWVQAAPDAVQPVSGSAAGLLVQVIPVEGPERILADPRLMKANARRVASLRDPAEAADDDEDAGKSKSRAKSQADPGDVVVVPIGLSQSMRLAARPIQVAGTSTGAVQAYEVKSREHGLRPGQGVYITVPHPNRDKLHKAIPYSAIIYDRNGETWVFTNPEPLVFVRARIDVDVIDGGRAFLKEGPPLGSKVVTAGAAVLMGIEQKFGQ